MVNLVKVFLMVLIFTPAALASSTRVGNGDDGGDLEERRLVETGVLIETRKKALDLLDKVNAKNIAHLGLLVDEVKSTKIYLVKADQASQHKFDKGMDSSTDGKYVYARTMARPHATTRFFPASLTLTESQLIALHIHEGLHRSLPESVREDEGVVTEITLAITEPGANFDNINSKTLALVVPRPALSGIAGLGATSSSQLVVNPTRKLERPSSFAYTYKLFTESEEDLKYKISGMHILESHMYPFGGRLSALGLGIGLSLIEIDGQSSLGPIKLSANYLLATWRKFDIHVWGEIQAYTVSDTEIENSAFARDINVLGISMTRDADRFYLRNSISVTGDSSVEQKIGNVSYTHTYGSIVDVGIRGGLKFGVFKLGANLDVLLSDSYSVNGGAFFTESGRYRLVTFGPEMAMNLEDFEIKVFAKTIIDKTQGVSLDYLGDIMGQGTGQGNIGASIGFVF